MWLILIALGWLYVALMMALAQAFHADGGLLSALFVFIGYGVAPVVLVLYLLGTPMRRRARRQREAAVAGAPQAAAAPAPAPAASTMHAVQSAQEPSESRDGL